MRGNILITGGTSGLGLEIARILAERGEKVFVTGRNPERLDEINGNVNFVFADFSDLKATSITIKNLFRTNEFNVLINNAGILSPPEKRVTVDGFEYTYQVNFLAHYLISEILLANMARDGSLTIASVISPVYKLAARKNLIIPDVNYNPLTEYSLSKLNLLRLPSLLSSQCTNTDIRFLSFNPGVFGSSIHRMQKGYFRQLYSFAAKVMTAPSKVAGGFINVLDNKESKSNVIYNRHGVMELFSETVPEKMGLLRQDSLMRINPFLSE